MPAESSSNPLSPNALSASEWQAIREERKRLELELIRVQREAKVAELNARAAELELQIEGLTSQLEGGLMKTESTKLAADADHALEPQALPEARAFGSRERTFLSSELDGAYSRESVIHRFANWQQLAELYEIESTPASEATSVEETQIDEPVPRVKPDADEKLLRFDTAHAPVRSPASGWEFELEANSMREIDPPLDVSEDLQVSENFDHDSATSKRRPLSLALSFLVHAVIVFLFAMVTFSSTRPKDQVALSASTVSQSSVEMETFSIESIEPVAEPSESFEPTENLVEKELDPLGEPSMTAPLAAAVSAPSNSMASSMQRNSHSAAAMMTKRSNSDAKMEFCGVDGGGNHFVYLVDSSGSMGSAFESARLELIRSIYQLKPHQKFYVIFFDSKPDFMRLSDPNRDEERSVLATDQNKAALQAWAMRITPDRGKNPNELLEFALDLRPDVIFLLSDGEFPQTTEDLLTEKNRRRNLFGDGGLISIVHTIAYHSREGESRMRRIADQNGGQYRYVPRPK